MVAQSVQRWYRCQWTSRYIIVCVICTLVSQCSFTVQGIRVVLEDDSSSVGRKCGRPLDKSSLVGSPRIECPPGQECDPRLDICLKTPPRVQQGGKCGSFQAGLAGRCALGLSCDFSASPLIADVSGICVDVRNSRKAKEGESCGGFTAGPPPVCDEGLKCDFSKNPPFIVDAPGICVKTGSPTGKGGVCGASTGAKCQANFTCEEEVLSTGLRTFVGICVDESCKKCSKAKRLSVCGNDLASKGRRTYVSRCYATCLAATNIKEGKCL